MRNALTPLEPFVVSEEEQFVSPIEHVRDDDRAADRESVLVLAQLALAGLQSAG